MQSFAREIFGSPIQYVNNISEFWHMSGTFCITTSLLETHGDREYLEKHSLYKITRNTEQIIEVTIEKLIEF